VTVQNTIWNIDPAHSVAEFKVKHMMIANLKGYFSKITGVLTRDESNVGDEVTINLDVEFVKA
jgi:polyisoprenoid-binding protein YceI